jgi:hypothetical protein
MTNLLLRTHTVISITKMHSCLQNLEVGPQRNAETGSLRRHYAYESDTQGDCHYYD